MSKKLICGMGINDATYTTAPRVNGVQLKCPYYRKWSSMIERCYSEACLKERPSYKGCTVTPEWLSFMTFREWMMTQDWEGNELDKDILIKGNSVYGPDTCLFVSQAVNSFILDNPKNRGKWPIGVYLHKPNKWRAMLSVPGRNKICLGVHGSPEEAHSAYLIGKQKMAMKLASEQNDPRVAAALIERYKL